ncbi:hypothetical protein [Kaarinaea lacus]
MNNNFLIPYYVLLLMVFAVITAGCSGSGDGTNNVIDDPNTKNVQVGADVPLASIAALESYDPESILFIEIEWTIVSKPPNSQATIINPESATPSFRPDIAGEYVIKVVIKQGGVVLAENVVTIIAGVDDLYPTKPAAHLLTTDICTACHSQDDWTIVSVDHAHVIGTCVSCHNGITATGKSATHIMSNDQCDVCHTTTTWGTPISAPDHTALIGSCVGCHNGVDASGKTATHINTTDMCDACHNVFPATWAPVPVNNVDHTQTLGSCMSCHDSVIATGKTQTHIITTADCGTCHSTAAWIPALSGGGEPAPPTDPTPPPTTVDHSGFTGDCITCHNGVDASGKSVSHPLTTDTCDACHGVTNWVPVLVVDHNQVIGTCESCHNGVSATGKGPNHLVTAEDCSACHVTTRWLPALSPGGTTDPLPTKPANHMPTTDLCEACHLPNGWVIGSVDHDQVIGTCVTCHDGVLATGKSPTHIASSDNCDECHVTTTWITSTLPVDPNLDHSTFVGTCVSCHNGVTASGKSATHINSTDTCEACHTVYPDLWVPIASVDHTQVLGTCESCHNSIIAVGKSPSHIQTILDCSVCHSTTAWLPAIN